MARRLRELIRQGESLEVEFKSDRGPLSDEELLGLVVCLANARGGVLVIGVEDDGTVTGLHEKHRTSPEQLAAFIAARTQPSLPVRASFESWEGRQVAVIEVPRTDQPVATSDGRLLIRYLDVHGRPGCRPLYPYELPAWRADRGFWDYTAQPVEGASWQDLDPLEFERLRRLVQEYHGDAQLRSLDDRQLARALNLVARQDRRYVPTRAERAGWARRSLRTPAGPRGGLSGSGRRVRLNEFYHWPLLRVFDGVMGNTGPERGAS